MLHLFMKRAKLAAKPAGLSALIEGLGPECRPVLRPALLAQADAMGVAVSRLRAAPSDHYRRTIEFAELLATDSGVIGITVEMGDRPPYTDPLTPPAGTSTNEREILLFGFGDSRIKSDLDDVSGVISQHLEIEIPTFAYESREFRKLREDGMTSASEPSEEEILAARLLAHTAKRTAAIAVASSGGLLVGDLPKQLDEAERPNAVAIAEALQSCGLVASDIVVICSRTRDQVLRVPSTDALTQVAAAGGRCACGREIHDEQHEEVLSLTPLGRRLLDGSWWMTVLLMDELSRLGIPHTSMMVEQSDGGDEMDCFADVSGELVLFELKDKEFNLRNAYSFGAKFGIYRPAYSVVVTTAHVGGDAKEHFKRALSTESVHRFSPPDHTTIRYIEGIETLAGGLEDLVGGVYRDDGTKLLRTVLQHAGLDPASVAEALLAKSLQSTPDADPAIL